MRKQAGGGCRAPSGGWGSNLLPGVEPQRGHADLLDLLLSGSKQQVPMRPGR